MQRIKYLFFALILIALLLPLIVAVSISNNTPFANNPETLNARSAIRIKRITSQLKHGMKTSRQRSISFTERDINAVLAFITRNNDQISASANIDKEITHITFSIYVPKNPFGDYINFQVGIPSTKQTLTFAYFKLGNIAIPGDIALSITQTGLDHYLGDAIGSELINSVKAVRVLHQRIRITYNPIQNITDKVTAVITRTSGANRSLALPADPELIPRYYAYLCRQHIPREQHSLGIYLSSLLTLANKPLPDNEKTISAAEHNKAALYAMAIYLGTEEFNVLVGAIPKQVLQHCQRNAPKTTLMERKDLSLHFIYSAAFKLIADSDISFSMGELKELQDSLYGGSGFSFVDLAADRAGIRFTELATSPEGALPIQKQASLFTNESLFFPDTSGLE
ncbi:hypothetical protein ACFL2V_22000, partial [Pseudomonadota bacterium]